MATQRTHRMTGYPSMFGPRNSFHTRNCDKEALCAPAPVPVTDTSGLKIRDEVEKAPCDNSSPSMKDDMKRRL